MRRTAIQLAILTVLFVGLTSSSVMAQPKCQPFSAVIQARVIPPEMAAAVLPPDLAGHEDYAWGGQVYGMLGTAKALLGGWFYGKDDESGQSTYGTANGRGRNGIYEFAFGTLEKTDDTFDLQLQQAVWTVDPDAIAYAGNYKASGRLANGTGIFKGATGQFTLHGDFAYWDTPSGPLSAWNPMLEGMICW